MTLRDKVSRDLHWLWDGVLEEPVPQDMLELLDKLK
jgi:hypothetical protein